MIGYLLSIDLNNTCYSVILDLGVKLVSIIQFIVH